MITSSYTQKELFKAYMRSNSDLEFTKSVEDFCFLYKDYLEQSPTTLSEMYALFLSRQNRAIESKSKTKTKKEDSSQLKLFL